MTNLNLKSISNQELVQRLLKLRQSERRITHLVLIHILEIESRRLYAELGYESLFAYLTKALGYSESGAYRRLQSARLLKSVENKEIITEKLEQGTLNLSQLTQVQKALRQAQKAEDTTGPTLETMLKKIQNKSTFETQKVLSQELNLTPDKQETLKPQSDRSVTLTLNFSPEEFKELERAKSLLSHICHNGKWADILVELAKRFNQQKLGKTLKRCYPQKPAKNQQLEMGRNHTNPPHLTQSLTEAAKSPSPSKRKYISIYIKRALLNHAQHCCEYRDSQSGKICGSRYQLQFDHVHPAAFGGGSEISNLRVLCRTHNLLMADKIGLQRPRF